MQRAPNAAEAELMRSLGENTVAVGYNSGPYDTLALEATRLHPLVPDLAQVWDPRLLQAPVWKKEMCRPGAR